LASGRTTPQPPNCQESAKRRREWCFQREHQPVRNPRNVAHSIRQTRHCWCHDRPRLLAAGTANAGTSDDQFFGALQQQGIGFGTPDSAITVAHHVCDALGQGMTPSDISGNIAGANAGIDRQTAVVIVVDAAQAYCPQFVHQMSNGATVVGPNR
jgi:hypothetical protein